MRDRRRHRAGAAFVGLVVACALGSHTAWAAPGDLDPSFGGGTGKAIADFGGSESGNAVALEPDGRIVVAGSSTATHPNADIAVAVFTNPGGVLDHSYGPGAVGGSLNDLGLTDRANALAIQPDGKIVVAGVRETFQTGRFDDSLAVVRYTYPGGVPDPSFGGGSGVSIADFPPANSTFGDGVALTPDGKIVVAGSSNATHPDPDFAVAVFPSSGGMLDPFYGSGSGASLNDLGGSDIGNAVVLQPDGKIIVAGTRTVTGKRVMAVVRYTYPQGVPDTTFGIGGSGVAIGDFGTTSTGNAVALQPNASDGKILVAGSTGEDFAVARFTNPQGTLDPSFASGGKTTIDFGGYDDATGMVVQPDGKILVAGTTASRTSGSRNFALARLQPDGVLDTTFGNNGKITFDLGGDDIARGVALQADGKILLAGSTDAAGTGDFAVVRFLGDPHSAAGGSGGGNGNSGGGGGGRGLGPAPGTGGNTNHTASSTPRCDGKRATIFGTSRGETLTGTQHADVIVGLGGKDTIKGRGGNDIICGGDGNDRVDGGTGNDRIYGQAGKDTLTGGNGRDYLDGGPNDDRLNGQAGNDTLLGGSGKDQLQGSTGKDQLNGQGGQDQCTGGPGQDHSASCETKRGI